MKFTTVLLVAVVVMFSGCARAENAANDKYQKFIKEMEGTWDATLTVQSDPEKPMKFSGVETNAVVREGRWLSSDFTGEQYHGHGLYGLDLNKNKFVSTWVDSYKPGMEMASGELNEAGNSVEMTGNDTHGGAVTVKTTLTNTDHNHRTLTVTVTGGDGKPRTVMTIQYTRKEK